MQMTTLLKTGDRLDHYRIDGLVACTALALTFRGTDLATGRKVAIKIPNLGDDPVVSERFGREEKIGRKLHHPNVVRVFCDAERSRLYLVTEWVEGRPLRAILDARGRLSPERAVGIAVKICDALYYIHSRGVVHRDLKPENVLLTSRDGIKLIDFGIATAGGAHGLALASPSEMMGTPDYISPEEVKGIRGDARSDIYALGVMLYEMLTGTMPFEGCSPLVVMNNRLIDDPVPIRAIVPDLRPGLEQIVNRALQRDPRRRYGSSYEFGQDLRFLDEPATAERASVSERRWLWFLRPEKLQSRWGV
jgi:eukaryotic-like serine/threonine-protein kinase